MTKLNIVDDSKNWYSQGLNFKCTGCGQCCTGAPGYVWLSEAEIHSISDFLQISRNEFIQKYTRQVDGKISLLENVKSYDCVFLKNQKSCSIYSVRPTQCRTYPWWPQLLKSEEDWKNAAQFCEGINLEAPLVSTEKINEQLHLQEEYTKKLNPFL